MEYYSMFCARKTFIPNDQDYNSVYGEYFILMRKIIHWCSAFASSILKVLRKILKAAIGYTNSARSIYKVLKIT